MILLLSYGTRPEWIKIKPLIKELKERNIEHYILFTGQHIDLTNIEYDYSFEIKDVSNNRLDNIYINILTYTNSLFTDLNDRITHVLVQGDTTSAVAVALSAFHHKKKIIHLEAGLRSNNKLEPFPEEINRKLISNLADIHICPTKESLFNLFTESIKGLKIIAGNTALDNLLEYKDMCEYGDTILITLHRRENLDIMDKWFEAVNNLAKKYPYLNFIIPLHPNPEVRKHKDLLTHVQILEPLEHSELMKVLVKTRLVITDSGGLQEECSFFNKKCLVCRTTTERPEALYLTSFIVAEPEYLEKVFDLHIDNYQVSIKSPFGDGFSSKLIVDNLYNINNFNNIWIEY